MWDGSNMNCQRLFCALGVGAVVLGMPVAATSESFSSRSRSTLFRSQLSVLDNRAAEQYSYSARLQPNAGDDGSIPAYRGGYTGPYLAVARDAATRHGIPQDLFLRLVQQESGWNPNAVSPKGAVGLAQLMPQTAAHLGVDPNDPLENLEGGARYLRLQYNEFGDWRLALAAYNAGPEAVRQYSGIPPYNETQNYVVAILGS